MIAKTVKEVIESLSQLNPEDVIAFTYWSHEEEAWVAEENHSEEELLEGDYSKEVFKQVVKRFNDDSVWEQVSEAFSEYNEEAIQHVINNKIENEKEEQERVLWDTELQEN